VRRLIRHLLLCCSALLLFMCAAMIWLWVRSYQGPDTVMWQSRSGRLFQVISGHGTVDFLVIPRWPQVEQTRYARWDPYVYYGTRYSKRLLGFGTEAIWPEYGGRYVNMPHWFFVVCFAGMGFSFVRAWWKRRPKRAEKCQVCGYDMRATPSRCPECGAEARGITGKMPVVRRL
jgi:hypothetical protein